MAEIPKDLDEGEVVNALIRHQLAIGTYGVLWTREQAEFLDELCAMLGKEHAFGALVERLVIDEKIQVLPTGDIVLVEEKAEFDEQAFRQKVGN